MTFLNVNAAALPEYYPKYNKIDAESALQMHLKLI